MPSRLRGAAWLFTATTLGTVVAASCGGRIAENTDVDAGAIARDGEITDAPGDAEADAECHTIPRGSRPDASASGRPFFPSQLLWNGEFISGLAIGDVTADARNDVAIAVSSSILIFAQNRCGGLEPPMTLPGSYLRIAIGDVTGDGRDDVVAMSSQGRVSVFAQLPGGGFDAAANYDPAHPNGGFLILGDFNHDGRTDVFEGADEGNLWLQTTAGALASDRSFVANPDDKIQWIGRGDFNGDHREDIIGATWSGLSVLQQRIDGGLEALAASTLWDGGFPPYHAAIGDFDHDGRSDVASNFPTGPNSAEVSIFLASGATGFRLGTEFEGNGPIFFGSLASGDLNGDGRTDLVVARGSIAVILQGDAGLQGPSTYSNFVPADLMALGDIDSDGKFDLISVTQSDPRNGSLLVAYAAP